MALEGKLFLAGPYDEKLIQTIETSMQKLLHQPVHFVVRQDSRLIGGFRAIVDGNLYDASILTKTQRMLGCMTHES